MSKEGTEKNKLFGDFYQAAANKHRRWDAKQRPGAAHRGKLRRSSASCK